MSDAGDGLLDTSAVISLGEVAEASAPPASVLIRTVTLAELSVGPLVARDEETRAARQRHLQQAEADFQVVPFDAAAAWAFGIVAASLRRSGREPAARAYDALIAATALANALPLHICNPEDFEGIDDLDLRGTAPVAVRAGRHAARGAACSGCPGARR